MSPQTPLPDAGKPRARQDGTRISSSSHLEEIESIYRHAPVGLCVIDTGLRYVRINDRLAEMNGFPAEDHIGRSVREMVPHLADQAEQQIRQVLESGEPLLDTEISGATAARPGVTRTWTVNWLPLRAEGGVVTGISFVVQEVTVRKQVENALRDSEERFRLFMDNSPVIAWIKDGQGRYTYISNTALARYNRNREDIIGKTDTDLFDPGTAEKLIRNDREVVQAGHAVYYDEEVIDSDGRFLYWHNSKFPFEDTAGNRFVGGIGIEITELKEIEEALQASEAKFRSLFEHSKSAVLLTVPDGTIEAANPAACAMFGCSEQEIRDGGGSGILDENDPRLPPALEERQRMGHVKAVELTGVRKGGEKFPVEVDSVILPFSPIHSFVILRDITERKRAEEALRESEARLSAILNQLPIGVGVFGKDGRAILRNDLMRRYMPEMMPSRDPDCRQRWHAVDSDGKPVPPEAWPGAQVLSGASVKAGMELNCIDDHGRESWLMVSAVPFSNLKGGEKGAIMTAQDITALKKAENALRETNQELNEHTYAVIHNVKAPFRAVQNYATFLIEELGESLEGEPRQFLEGMDNALRQARHQFDDLDALYRIRAYDPDVEPVDMTALLDDIQSLHQNAGDRRLIVPGHWPVVWAEIFLLRQILTELIANGFKYNRSEIKEVEVGWRLKHNRLVISVRDNGIGIDPHYHDHIFHIFKRLHTEDEYDGTGIGLAIVRRAVRKIGGEVNVRSAAGEGSTFFISLPAAQGRGAECGETG